MNASEQTRKELTVRGLIIGIIITLVFTAANVYFGLKAGQIGRASCRERV